MKNNGIDHYLNNIGYQYYRSTLDASGQKAYDSMYYGFLTYEEEIDLHGLGFKQFNDILQKLKNDNPQLFFIETASFQYNPISWSGRIIPQYRFPKEKADQTLIAIQERYEPIIEQCRLSSDIQKEKQIHDLICKNVYYDKQFAESSFECVGPLLFGKGVCSGISKAAKLLFDHLGLKTIYIYGEASENAENTGNDAETSHAWNLVFLDNAFYHLDITFDLTISSNDIIRYDYFNLSDSEISNDHKILAAPVPHCQQSGDYYVKNNLYMRTTQEFTSYLEQSVRNGKTDIVIKLPRVDDFERAKIKILNIAEKYLNSSYYSSLQFYYNRKQWVFHLHYA